MSTETQFKLELSSKPRNINKVEPFVQNLKRHYQIGEELYFNMLLVLTEAVNNSILHGNEADPAKQVRVDLNVRQSTLCFMVKDEGKGFNPNTIPDPTSPERLCEPCGRGVFLMKALADRLDFSNNGSTVEISFNLE